MTSYQIKFLIWLDKISISELLLMEYSIHINCYILKLDEHPDSIIELDL